MKKFMKILFRNLLILSITISGLIGFIFGLTCLADKFGSDIMGIIFGSILILSISIVYSYDEWKR